MKLTTQYEFTLPRGYVDREGELHRNGLMRLATARDELEMETAVFVSHEFTEAAGLPSRHAARRLFAAASQALWS